MLFSSVFEPHSAVLAAFRRVYLAFFFKEKMSLKIVGTALTRTIWTRGNTTPPLARSPKASRLSTSCMLSGARKQCCEKTKEQQSCSSDSDRPSGDAPPSSEPLHACTPADKKRPKEPVGAPGVSGVRRRSFTSTAAPMDQRSYLWSRYNEMKRLVHGKHGVPSLWSHIY